MSFDKIIAVRTDKTVYRDGDRCLKVFGKEYSKAEVLVEALNQARAEEAGLNVPKLLGVTVTDGKWTIVSEYIKGKTLERIAIENSEKRDECIAKLVDVQLEMQSKSCAKLRKLRDRLIEKINAADIPATARYSIIARLAELPTHNKICHGGFTLSNVMLGDNGKTYILDWIHATRGNASADAAFTYFRFGMNGAPNDAEKYLELFCKKSGTERQYVQKWMPVIATAQSVTGNAREREFLIPFINEINK